MVQKEGKERKGKGGKGKGRGAKGKGKRKKRGKKGRKELPVSGLPHPLALPLPLTGEAEWSDAEGAALGVVRSDSHPRPRWASPSTPPHSEPSFSVCKMAQ